MTYTLTKLPDERITGNLESFWLRIGFNLDKETIRVTDAQLGIYQSQSSKTKPRPGRPGFEKPTASYAIADSQGNTLTIGPVTHVRQQSVEYGNEIARLSLFEREFDDADPPNPFLTATAWGPTFQAPVATKGTGELLQRWLDVGKAEAKAGESVLRRYVYALTEIAEPSGAVALQLIAPCLKPPISQVLLASHGKSIVESFPIRIELSNRGKWSYPQPLATVGTISGCTIIAEGAFKGLLTADLGRWVKRPSGDVLGQLSDIVARAPASPRTLANCSDLATNTVVSPSSQLPVEILLLDGLAGTGGENAKELIL